MFIRGVEPAFVSSRDGRICLEPNESDQDFSQTEASETQRTSQIHCVLIHGRNSVLFSGFDSLQFVDLYFVVQF